MTYVRNPILILKDARTEIIHTRLVCQMYANSPGAEFLIHYRRLFFHLHIPWHARLVKIPLGMTFSLVCRDQSGNVLSLKDIQDRAYCCTQ